MRCPVVHQGVSGARRCEVAASRTSAVLLGESLAYGCRRSVLLSNVCSIGVDVTASSAERAAVLALTKATRGEWYKTAALITETGSALAIVEDRLPLLPVPIENHARELITALDPADLERAGELIERASSAGARLITVLDDDYPSNLHQIYNRPPFIFVRGALQAVDSRSIAVVGTRQASDSGLAAATTLAHQLAEAEVTVMSGLALGIDTAAHTSSLAGGGRTVAVIGNGILAATYPSANRELAERIESGGAVVSQFWPDAPPTRYSFPMRNVVMSGMALGTVVVEASATSGAKMQARLCIEHGKRLFLLDSLVTSQDWARKYADRPGVTVVRRIEDVIDVLVTLCRPLDQQMSLAF